MRPFAADLHVHSVLSPCADELMLPSLVVDAARRRGIALLGLVDHNSAENAAAFVAAAEGSGVTVFPGIEVTTREEVHVLTLFPSVEAVTAWQAMVYTHLPDLPNDDRVFGTQIVVNAADEFVRLNERLLLTATDLSLSEVMARAGEFGGVAMPAHVDRPAFGLLGQLGFVPADLGPCALEISRHLDAHGITGVDTGLAGHVLVRSSDAHFLHDVGTTGSVFWLEEATFDEVALALKGERTVTNPAVTL